MASQAGPSGAAIGGGHPGPQASVAGPASAGHPTPESMLMDKRRVALILEINQLLLEEIMKLQAEGKGGNVQSPAGAQQPEPAEHRKPAREWIECLKRMQANLAYLASLAERHAKPNLQTQPWPQIMSGPPSDNAQLAAMYVKLQSMYPMWMAQQQDRMRAAQQAGMQAPSIPGQQMGMPQQAGMPYMAQGGGGQGGDAGMG